MGKTLVVAETDPKAKTIAGILRNNNRDTIWVSVPLTGVKLEWPRKGRSAGFDSDFRPLYDFRNRTALNRMLTEAQEAVNVLIAFEDDGYGESFAYHTKREIIGKWPNKSVRRMRLRSLTGAAVKHALDNIDDVDDVKAKAFDAKRVLDRMIGFRLKKPVGFVVGRAMSPALSVFKEVWGSPVRSFVAASFKHGLFGGDSVVFRTAPMSSRLTQEIIDATHATHLVFEEEAEVLVLPTPAPLDSRAVLDRAAQEYGLKAIEVVNQAQHLYHLGYITRLDGAGVGMDWEYVRSALIHLKTLVGQSYCRTNFSHIEGKSDCCRPTDINVDPSKIPTPVRPLYRLLWASSLAACSVHARVERKIISFDVPTSAGPVQFQAESYKIVEPGFTRASMGLLMPGHELPSIDSLELSSVDSFEAWPTEQEAMVELSQRLGIDNPVYLLKALENNEYILYDRQSVYPTLGGLRMLDAVSEAAPELADPGFFAQSEYRLDGVASGEFSRVDVLSEYQEWVMERM